MDTQHENLRSEYNDLNAEDIANNILGRHRVHLLEQVHSMQWQLQDPRHPHDVLADLHLVTGILANEDAATHLNTEQISQLAQERQGLLLDGAALLVYDRGIVPWELRTAAIDDCIGKYNDLEKQKVRNDKEEPPLIGYDEVRDRYTAFVEQAEAQKQTAHARNRMSHGVLSLFTRRG